MTPIAKFFFFSIFVSLNAVGQTNWPVLNNDITTTKTVSHKNVAGTRIFLVPPADFKPLSSGALVGFEKGNKQAGILVTEVKGGSYVANGPNFSKENFEKKGITVLDFRELTINGFAAKYVLVKKTATERSVMLIFGDATFATMVTAVYPSGDKATETAVFKSLESIWYNKDLKIDHFANAAFSIGENSTNFKYFSTSMGFHMYTPEGKDPSVHKEAPLLMITEIPPNAGTNTKLIAETMLERIGKVHATDLVTKNVSADKINGMDAYEIGAVGQKNGKDVLIYSCAISTNGISIVVVAIAQKDLAEATNTFKTFSRAVRLKQ